MCIYMQLGERYPPQKITDNFVGKSMPDWKQARDYAFTKNLTVEGWVWEFLRRNPDYRKDFEATVQGEQAHLKGRKAGFPPWSIPSSMLDAKGMTPRDQMALEWRMKPGYLPDPASDSGYRELSPAFPVLLRDEGEARQFFVPLDRRDDTYPVREGNAVLVFNLRISIEPQLKSARQHLKYLKIRVKKQSGKNFMPARFRLYLRLLDAKEAKATTSQIIKILKRRYGLPNTVEHGYQMTDRVSDDLKAARNLRDNPFALFNMHPTK